MKLFMDEFAKMSDKAKREYAAALMVEELNRARQKFLPMASAHEGFAIVLEEIDELWEIVKQKQSARNYSEFGQEVIQCGAMLIALMTEIVLPENRR